MLTFNSSFCVLLAGSRISDPSMPGITRSHRIAAYRDVLRVLSNIHSLDFRRLGLSGMGRYVWIWSITLFVILRLHISEYRYRFTNVSLCSLFILIFLLYYKHIPVIWCRFLNDTSKKLLSREGKYVSRQISKLSAVRKRQESIMIKSGRKYGHQDGGNKTDVDGNTKESGDARWKNLVSSLTKSAKECPDNVSLIHGDYKIDNLVFHATEPRVIAVLDWELRWIQS